MNTFFIKDSEHYSKVILQIIEAKSFVWIGTADIKDLHVKLGAKTVSFLAVLNSLICRKVQVRLLHAKEPGCNFRKSFDKFPKLWDVMERQLCPRVHFKIVVVDGKYAYLGSANLTGAALGIKSADKRNFEAGIVTEDAILIHAIMNQFDEVWIGKFCKTCKRKIYCIDPII